MRKSYGLAALALVAIAVAGLWAATRPAGPGQTALVPGMTALAQDGQAAPDALPEVAEMSLGNPEAKVIIEA